MDSKTKAITTQESHKLIKPILNEVIRLITEKLNHNLGDECEIAKGLFDNSKLSLWSFSLPQEALFSLNSCIENYIITQMEIPDAHSDDDHLEVDSKCEAVLDLCWQSINCGKWSEVPVELRKLYGYHRLLKTVLILIGSLSDCQSKSALDHLVDALDSIDHALIMSPDLNGRLFSTVANLIHRNIISLLESNVCDNSSNFTKWTDVLQKIQKLKLNQNAVGIPYLNLPQDRTIARVDCIDFFDFESSHFRPRVPIIITCDTKMWPCMSPSKCKWSLEYLLRRIAFRLVPIEIGSKYTEEEWSQKLMKVIDFIDQFILGDHSKVGYLAQHNLFEQIPELAEDFTIPDLCATTEDDDNCGDTSTVDINAWFGPAGTVSPLHTDPKHNLFVQILGRKYVRLYSADTPSEQIYPYGENLLSNTSAVDLESVDTSRFGAFKSIDSELIHECIVEEGEMLYIPKQWWHYVKSLDVSFSLSFWW